MRNIGGWHRVPNKKGKYPSVLGYVAGDNIPINLRLSEGQLDIQPERESDRECVETALRPDEFGDLRNPLICMVISDQRTDWHSTENAYTDNDAQQPL
jgi:hypothetical protein